MTPTTVRDAALQALAAGLNPLPPREDGSKAPDATEWTTRQTTMATEAEVRSVYTNGRTGLGLVCGAVSGGLELFEFEGRAIEAGLLPDFVAAAKASGLGDLVERIAAGYTERTPSGGLHWLVRTDSPITKKLASGPDHSTLIETRGEGGYVITAPSHGSVHASGKPWEMMAGSFATIATITAEEQADLHRLAATFDQRPRTVDRTEHHGSRAAPGPSSWEVTPGDDFNARAAWPEILEPHGWRRLFTASGGNEHWVRPGKERGTSATVNDDGAGVLYVFTSSTPFEPNTAVSRFGAYTVLNHQGDYKLAAKALEAEGYGRRVQRPADHHVVGAGDHHAGDHHVVESWPTLDPAALYGLAGEVVQTLAPHTEADPAAVLGSFLVAFGAAVNAGPHAIADGADHPPRLFVVVVGATSRGRKGTAWANVRRIMVIADPGFTTERILGGLASGEGLIAAVSDGALDKDGNLVGAVDDKRLLVYEPEFSRVLKVCARDSSTLSSILRDAWDRGDLRVMTRKDPLRASGAHVCLLAHVTVAELRRSLLESDAANGYGNRHLFVASRRSKRLPAGGNLDDQDLHALALRVRTALTGARRVGILRRSPEAEALWATIYNAIDDEVDGMVGALTARAEAQMLRLSVVYALLDGSNVVEVHHLEAARAVWRYSEATIAHVYGKATGDPVADRLLAALREAGDEGLDRQAQRDVFARNIPAARVAQARESLSQRGLVMTTTEDTGGRPRAVTRITQQDAVTQEGTNA